MSETGSPSSPFSSRVNDVEGALFLLPLKPRASSKKPFCRPVVSERCVLPAAVTDDSVWRGGGECVGVEGLHATMREGLAPSLSPFTALLFPRVARFPFPLPLNPAAINYVCWDCIRAYLLPDFCWERRRKREVLHFPSLSVRVLSISFFFLCGERKTSSLWRGSHRVVACCNQFRLRVRSCF